MYPIVLKYLQFVCVAVLFEKINCDQLQLNSETDNKLLHGIIGCTALCMNKNFTLVIQFPFKTHLNSFSFEFFFSCFCLFQYDLILDFE